MSNDDIRLSSLSLTSNSNRAIEHFSLHMLSQSRDFNFRPHLSCIINGLSQFRIAIKTFSRRHQIELNYGLVETFWKSKFDLVDFRVERRKKREKRVYRVGNLNAPAPAHAHPHRRKVGHGMDISKIRIKFRRADTQLVLDCGQRIMRMSGIRSDITRSKPWIFRWTGQIGIFSDIIHYIQHLLLSSPQVKVGVDLLLYRKRWSTQHTRTLD